MTRSLIILRPLCVLLLMMMQLPAAFAQTDTIDQRHHPLNTRSLQPGLRQYLVYFQFPAQAKVLSFSLWTRDVTKRTRNNQMVIEIRQHWYSQDSARYREIFSVNSAADFSPLYHYENNGGKIKAYNWSATGISGADTTGNTAAGYKLDFNGPNYNWNLDIETFEMLPLETGKTFVINFYDAGLDPPSYVTYKVAGSEILTTLGNQQVDCWMLRIEGSSPQIGPYTQTFWISKKGHELLKEVDSYSGIFRYKIKLPALVPNLPEIFKKR